MATRTMTKATTRTMKKTSRFKTVILPILVVLILVGGGAGYYFWNQAQSAAAAATTASSAPKTTTVRRGSLTISAAGTGTLSAIQQTQLSFSIAGTVKKVNVQVGDVVKAGQVLAELEHTASLDADLNTATQTLTSAQQALATLQQGGAGAIANMQLKVATDQKAITDAQSALKDKGMQACDQKTTDAYYAQYDRAQKDLTNLGDGGGNTAYYLNTIVPAKNKVAQAYAAYLSCAGYTQYQIDASHATLTLAQSQLKQDQATLTTLQQNNGVTPTDLAQAQNKVNGAKIALDGAQQNLDGIVIKAPTDGTILSVTGNPGDNTTTATFISMADMLNPQVQFIVDETDMDKVAMNEAVQVAFDAIPNRTFTGKVVRINPTLVTVNGYQTVQGLVQLDLSKEKDLPAMPIGLNASVTIIRSQANNVLLAPVQALRDLGGGQYGVFVVKSGKMSMKVVEVGVMDTTNAEIKSGLSAGDVISTGTADVKNAQSTSNTTNGQ